MQRTLLTIALAGTVLWFWAPWKSDRSDEVFNRLWVSDEPKDPKQHIDVFITLDDEKFGIFQTASAYEGNFAAFGYQRADPALELEMLQSGQRYRVLTTVKEKCREGYDLCLTIVGAPRGPTTYYSQEDWVVDSRQDAERAIRKVLRAHH